MKKARYVVASIVIIIAIASFWIGSYVVDRSGTESLPVDNPVEVIYDENAIPHIYAKSELDAYRALGYVHAKDRLFQMEMMRRLSSGRLAEILGPDLIKIDTLFRTIGIRKVADEYYEKLDKKSDSFLATEAYLEGINHFIENGKTPIEFSILGIEKEKYDVKDILMISGYMAYSFAAALKHEPLLTEIQNLGTEYLNEVAYGNRKQDDLDADLFDLKKENANAESSIKQSDPTARMKYSQANSELHRELAKFFLETHRLRLHFGAFQGSNAMLIAPERSQTGHAILVSDPHISFSQPSVWFEAHLSTPEHEIYGHYLAMVPVPLLGHNRNIAWGLTMLENDDMDLFYETQNPNDKNEFLFRGRYQKAQTVEEVIRVKGEDDVKLGIRWTRNGPILNDAIESLADKKPVSLKWEFHDPENRILDAFYGMEHAKSIDEFEKSVSLIRAPGLNIMYADSEGNIAWWAAGRLAIRPPGANPALIQDGSGKHAYLGYRPFYQNPMSKNPNRGFIVSANQQPDTRLDGYFCHIWRAYRIHELLKEEDRLSIDELKQIHSDVSFKHTKIWYDRFFEGVDPAEFSSNFEREAYDLLMSWDGRYAKDSNGAVIASELLSQIAKSTYEDELGQDLYKNFQEARFFLDTMEKLSKSNNSPWWDNVKTDEKETRKDIVKQALKSAVQTISEYQGTDISDWNWGDYHQVEYVHAVGRKKPMNLLFNVGPLRSAGADETVFNMGHEYPTGPRKITYGPSTRRIIDMGNPDSSLGINPTGQSGVFVDPYYSNQKQTYLDRKYRPQRIKREEIEEHSIGTLKLVPLQ